MSGSSSKTILVGNVGKDPEIRTMSNGEKVASFSLATGESWKDKNTGEKKERTEWHRVAVFNKHLVDVVERYVKKGDKLYIEGQNETRKWTDNNGVEKWTTEVVLRPFRGEITMLSQKSHSDAPAHEEPAQDLSDIDDQSIPF